MGDLSLSREPLGETITLSLSLQCFHNQNTDLGELNTKHSVSTIKKRSGRVEHKTQESTFANFWELFCPRPRPPNGMEKEDVTPTSLLMRKLAFFISRPWWEIWEIVFCCPGEWWEARLANLIAFSLTTKAADLNHNLTLHHCFSPCLCLWNNNDDDQDTAEAGPDVEALGQVEVVLAGKAVRKVDSGHPLPLHHLSHEIYFPKKYIDKEKFLTKY